MSDAVRPEPGLTDATPLPEDVADPALRPKALSDFVGQGDCVRQLRIFIDAARSRGEAVDHVLLSGPPGLGKTTLAQIVANEMRFGFVQAAAPAITKPGDMAALLTSLQPWTVLFLDEIHRLNKIAAEMLYTAMEDRRLDLIIGEGASAKSVSIELQPFTLVGATTRPGMLPGPLLDRFGIQLRLDFYAAEDLTRIVARTAQLMGIAGDDGAFGEIARRARGTPRIAKRLLRRVRDVAHSEGLASLTAEFGSHALQTLGVDANGLDLASRRYLQAIARNYGGGPVGIETLCASLAEDRDIIETFVEPYLMICGMVQRTPRGRVITELGYEAIGRVRVGSHAPPPFSGQPAGSLPVQQAFDLGSGR